MIVKNIILSVLLYFISVFCVPWNLYGIETRILDSFDQLEGWKIINSDQVEIKIQQVAGYANNALRIDYNFLAGTGYGGIQKEFLIDLPENYQFSFYLKGESPANNFEFKILDPSGENVWWVNQRNFEFPTNWKKIIIKKRHISFAWGPTENRNLRQVNKIEFIIASANGGNGTIFLDQLMFESLDPPDIIPPQPVITVLRPASSSPGIQFVQDGDTNTYWLSSALSDTQEILIDFQKYREFGGLVIHWDKQDYARKYDIWVSNDQKDWILAYRVMAGAGGRRYIFLKDFDSRYLKIVLLASNRQQGYLIKEIQVENFSFSTSKENLFSFIASEKPRGHFPRYFYNEQSYWTIVGVDKDRDEALINEEGMIEVDKGCFSIEPFIYHNQKLITWNEVEVKQFLERDYLPIPKVQWSHPDFQLEIQCLATGPSDSSMLLIKYNFQNRLKETFVGKFYVTLRPFQVNTPWQFLNNPGGLAKIDRIYYDKDSQEIQVNQEKFIYLLTEPSAFGVAEFDEGDITEYLEVDRLPLRQSAHDHFGCASAAVEFALEIPPEMNQEVFLLIPFHEKSIPFSKLVFNDTARNFYNQQLEETSQLWERRLNYVQFYVPPEMHHLVNSLRSNLAYILINRDGAGIQPGSRSYERSWIRDGSLTSSALLKMGIHQPVKEFIEWYSQYQGKEGKVPCVVDRRGPDPVPENDSHGQLIFAIMQYFRFTHDTTFLRVHYAHIQAAVNYLEYLMNQRLTEYYRNGNDSLQSLYGLLPESISHEGYSDKPRHSYWDNFFALKGLKDAVTAARILNEKEDLQRFIFLRDLFEKNLYQSLGLSIKRTGIDYLPGCAELGDFDATSTAIAIYPCGELSRLPQPYAQQTFDRYFNYFNQRQHADFQWRDYTPYEVRLVGTFILLNQPERAHQLLNYFFGDQRPPGWNHWAEVVRKGYRTAGFIGDMPHTWVGSDFINAVRTFFAYEEESSQSLIIAAGIKKSWIDSPEGVAVQKLPTYYGLLDYSIIKKSDKYFIRIKGDFTTTPRQFRLKNIWSHRLRSVTVNGKKTKSYDQNYIYFYSLPAELIIQ